MHPVHRGYPPVVNSEREAVIALRAATSVVGASGIVHQEHPSMGAEDFGYLLKEIPGCYVRYGARISEDDYIPLHSPRFDINEDVLGIGAAFLERVAREAIQEHGRDSRD